jgi:hypothetical protein
MWQSMGNMDYRPKIMKRASDPSPDSAKHRFCGHNRPDDWLGPNSKPARKSWTAKKIVESEDTESSTTPEAPTEVAEEFPKGVGARSFAHLKASSRPDDLAELKVDASSKVVDIGNQEDLLPVSPKSFKEEDQDTAQLMSAELKALLRGDLMKEQGNNPISSRDAAHIH